MITTEQRQERHTLSREIAETLKREILTAPAGGLFHHTTVETDIRDLHVGFANEAAWFVIDLGGGFGEYVVHVEARVA